MLRRRGRPSLATSFFLFGLYMYGYFTAGNPCCELSSRYYIKYRFIFVFIFRVMTILLFAVADRYIMSLCFGFRCFTDVVISVTAVGGESAVSILLEKVGTEMKNLQQQKKKEKKKRMRPAT
jgi:hypothetical protein